MHKNPNPPNQPNDQAPGAPPPGNANPELNGNRHTPTDRRSVTSRRNAQKSTGPQSPEGKLRVSQNAVTHGLLSKAIVLNHESPDVFNRVLQDYIDEYQPQSPTELAYIETMTAAHWRKNRLLLVEKAAFQREIDAAQDNPNPETLAERTGTGFMAFCEKSRFAELLNRYEARHDRQFARAEARLQRLQARRRAPGNGSATGES